MRDSASARWILGALAGVLLAACGGPADPAPAAPGIGEGMSVEEARQASDDLQLQGGAPEQQAVFDFSGRVEEGPSKDTALAGRLTLDLKPAGGGHFVFMGALTGANNLNVPARGVLTRGGRIFVFLELDRAGNRLIAGTGRREAGGAFKGPFVGPAAGDRGGWTATPVSGPTPMPNPTPQRLSYNFGGLVEDGPAKGTKLEGKLSLEVRVREGYGRLEGKLVLADNSEIPVRGAVAGERKVFLIFDLGSGGRIVGEGEVQADKSIKGPFVLVKREGEKTLLSKGSWTATPIP